MHIQKKKNNFSVSKYKLFTALTKWTTHDLHMLILAHIIYTYVRT